MSTHELDLIWLLNQRTGKKNKKGKNKGCFGGKNRFLGNYNTLQVLPKNKRTEDNCNECGVIINKKKDNA